MWGRGKRRAALERDFHDRLDLGLAWTAHELRAPLLAAKAAVARVVADGTGRRDTAALKDVVAELEVLSEMTEALLLVATDRPRLGRRGVDLVAIARAAIDSAVPLEDRDRIALQAAARVMVVADPALMRCAIANLLRNATAYSPAGTPVVVEASSDGSTARVAVQDRGHGVDPDEQEAIFAPYLRGERSAGTRGTGLGLYVVRKAIEAHGGEVWVEGSDAGATFTFEVPVHDHAG